MDRRTFLALAGTGTIGALAGCVSSAGDDGGSPPVGNGAETDEYGEIEVSASGSAETDPDMAVVRLGVEASGSSADGVRTDLAEGAAALRETFDALEIPDERVRTATFRIRQRRQGGGFEGTHAFSVEVDDVDRVGEVVDAAVDAGADDVGRVNFTLREATREALREEALDDALANADAEAEHVAANRGVDIVATGAVSTSDVSVGPLNVEYYALATDDAAAPETEFETGPVTVSASVTVVYLFDH
ncbi:SIMPL domain-containing protein [Natronobiforma cellulositropha]|uniref:SIMPL domain-containing protein n=1 Tax=Natronobiforma cellulositropha TaxID=1679076 RepID=UPI0021D5ECA4|nr:SIMPL domain-containing protein [Natronobiforma cellulositropha]